MPSKRTNKLGIFAACLLVLLGFVVYSVNAGVHFIVQNNDSTAPTETKSCWQQGYRLTFCPSGTCPSCKDENNVTYYKNPDCDTKYIYDTTTCPSPNTPSGASCGGKFDTCDCDSSYKYGPGRQTCDNNPGGGSCTASGKTYYKTCDCSVDYQYTCSSSVGQIPVNAGDTCGGKYKDCKCIQSSVPEGQRCTQKVSNGLTCYVDCKEDAKTCATEGYVDACPSGQTGTTVTVGALTCYKDCASVMSCDTLINKINNTAEGGTIEVSGAVLCVNKTVELRANQILKGTSSGSAINFTFTSNVMNGVLIRQGGEISNLKIGVSAKTLSTTDTAYSDPIMGAIRIMDNNGHTLLKDIDVTYKLELPLVGAEYGYAYGAIVLASSYDTPTSNVELAGTINITDLGKVETVYTANKNEYNNINARFYGIVNARDTYYSAVSMSNTNLNININGSMGYAMDKVSLEANSSKINLVLGHSGGMSLYKTSSINDTEINIKKLIAGSTDSRTALGLQDGSGSLSITGNSVINYKTPLAPTLQSIGGVASGIPSVKVSGSSQINILGDDTNSAQSGSALLMGNYAMSGTSQINVYVRGGKDQNPVSLGLFEMRDSAKLRSYNTSTSSDTRYYGHAIYRANFKIYNNTVGIWALAKNSLTFSPSSSFSTVTLSNLPYGLKIYTNKYELVANTNFSTSSNYTSDQILLLNDISEYTGNVLNVKYKPEDYFTKNSGGKITTMPSDFMSIFESGVFVE